MMRVIIAACCLLVSGTALAGYDVHITRKAIWSENRGPRITFAEWRTYVRTDPQVKPDLNNLENDFIVSLPQESFPLWFDPDNGEVLTKDPSKNAFAKLIAIAKQLHARVQGDDLEFYPPKPLSVNCRVIRRSQLGKSRAESLVVADSRKPLGAQDRSWDVDVYDVLRF